MEPRVYLALGEVEVSQRKTFWHYLPIGVLVALIASTAWMITFALIYSQSAILNISDWELTKRKNRINLLGADESLLTRSVFARGEFQGNAWYGFQEILSREKFHPQQISFDFRLSTELSHLSLIFGSGEKGSIALRFSRHPEFPAGLFLVSFK